MSYPATLEYLYGLQKHGIKLGLDPVMELLARLGQPQRRYRTIHVGGTNGKGSTAAMIAAVLQAAGYRVGLYTSPHLVDFRERIRVNGLPISEKDMTTLTARLRDLTEPDSALTFFEFTTGMAFQHFADSGAEVAVIEVGMGGQFDATNVLAPLVSVITNVALDHQEYLGETVQAIAYEKAGIIKPGVPLVTGRLSPEAAEVIGQMAVERQAPLFRWDREFRAQGDPRTGFDYQGIKSLYRGLSCPLDGVHQLENAACGLAALELASTRGLAVPEEAVRAGLPRTSWEGRIEVVERSPTLLLDGAHNPAAGAALAAYLNAYRREHPDSRIILVVGMMRDKDREGFFRLLLPLADEVVLTQAQVPRSASTQELMVLAERWAGSCHAAVLPSDALTLARRLASPADLICITGSLMLVGEIKALLRGCGLSPIRG
jgi:dihydrofolate synthase/folylpolyglutamate synthase